MHKTILLILFLMANIWAEKLEIIQGTELSVCQEYFSALNHKGNNVKFRHFKGERTTMFSRPKWEKLEVEESNILLLGRVKIYQDNLDAIYQHPFKTLHQVKKYWNDYVVEKHHYFDKAILDIDFDGKDEVLIRMQKNGYPSDEFDYSKTFIISVVVVNEDQQTVNIEKSKLIRQAFGKEKAFDGSRGPERDLETDNNLFFYKDKLYMDVYWKRLLVGSGYPPLLKVSELTKEGQKDRCVYRISYN